MSIHEPTDGREISLVIPGMHCGNCVGRVARAIAPLEGVTVSSLSVGSASVKIDESAVQLEELLDVLERAGYPATVAGS